MFTYASTVLNKSGSLARLSARMLAFAHTDGWPAATLNCCVKATLAPDAKLPEFHVAALTNVLVSEEPKLPPVATVTPFTVTVYEPEPSEQQMPSPKAS